MADDPINDAGNWKVFISYSWDSEQLKAWVLGFANRLRSDGIDTILDQTHLRLGGRSPEFMERSVRDSRAVLIVCTEGYKQRFDGRKGGAGYEGHIITGGILNSAGTNKFIPVLRNGEWQTAVPTALNGLFGVDLGADSVEEYRRLVRHLHGINELRPVGHPPDWLHEQKPGVPAAVVTPQEYWEQRKRLPDSEFGPKNLATAPLVHLEPSRGVQESPVSESGSLRAIRRFRRGPVKREVVAIPLVYNSRTRYRVNRERHRNCRRKR